MSIRLYRFHFLDHRNHFSRSSETAYAADAFACEAARRLFQREPIEVWQHRRFVCRMDQNGLHIAGTPLKVEAAERLFVANVEKHGK